MTNTAIITVDTEVGRRKDRPSLPSQRLVSASFAPPRTHSDEHDSAPFAQLLDIINPFLSLAGYREIRREPDGVSWEWIETDTDGAHYLLSRYLCYSQAYDAAIRDERTAVEIAGELIAENARARLFSNHEVVMKKDGRGIDQHVGALITDYTFEFGFLFLGRHQITLFVSVDED